MRFTQQKVLLVLSAFCLISPIRVQAEETAGTTVQYENLRELLKAGNLTLKESYDSYYETVKDYEAMRDALKWSQSDMEAKAENLKDSDQTTAAVYSSNAAMLKSSASRINDQIDTMNTEKSTRSLEQSADSMTMTAQTLMNSYNQMAANLVSTEKNVEALQASYDSLTRKKTAGAATEAEVLAAQKNLRQAQISRDSLKENTAKLREQLLQMLGLENSSQISIGGIPTPDLAAIDSLDFAADLQKAINNSSSVQNQRHSKASGTLASTQKQRQTTYAEGNTAASFEQTYQSLLGKRAAYEAARQAYDSASLVQQSLDRKLHAGLISQTEYLQGQADFAAKQAALEIASMNLCQAYETYCWEVLGVSA